MDKDKTTAEERTVQFKIVSCPAEERTVQFKIVSCPAEERTVQVEIKQVETLVDKFENYEGNIGFQLPTEEEEKSETVKFVFSPNGDL